MGRILPLLMLPGILLAQSGGKPIANPGFEEGEVGSVPPGWFVPEAVQQAGFGASLAGQGCRTGARCAAITGVANAPEYKFGNLMQNLPALGYTAKHIRLRSAVRVEGDGTRAQMWLRLDREDGTMAFLDNMGARPIRSPEWKTYDIETNVPADVRNVAFGVMLFGSGKVWVDDFTLEVLGEVNVDAAEPPRPVSWQGLINLTAFAKLYGYVRFFHPSDQAAATDWEAFAIEGVRKTESAASAEELATRLQQLFQPIAPSVQLLRGGAQPAPSGDRGPEFSKYKHTGVGLTKPAGGFTAYTSVRQRVAAAGETRQIFRTEIAPGLEAYVPLTVYADATGTLPHLAVSDTAREYERSAGDRATRIADVVIAWNIFQHFYPYFDVVKTDWPRELTRAIQSAGTDAGVEEFQHTLERLVAALRDGHGRVMSPLARLPLQPPLTLDWVEGQLLVTRVQKGKAEGLAAGDRVLKLDGKPVERAASETRELISGATEQWIRYRSAGDLSRCNPKTQRMSLELEPIAIPGTSRSVDLACSVPKAKDMETYTEPRPEKIAELEPGILYVDLDRVTEEDWIALVPRLEKAKGIIFDMRGYPGRPGIQALAHLTDTPIRSAKWNIPVSSAPDRTDTVFELSGWDVAPEKPYFSARRVFLTDGRAISYAETVMGIVENYKLGEIVGGATAGTNGNVNPFRLPGGFVIAWTGMKVLKHDGSQHHGIGILPTVEATRTRAGVAAGKDEILERGLVAVKAGLR